MLKELQLKSRMHEVCRALHIEVSTSHKDSDYGRLGPMVIQSVCSGNVYGGGVTA